MLKRSIDVVGALLLLTVMSPVLAAIAVALRLEGYGPIFYGSPRVGRGGKPFSMLRFRTMLDTPEPHSVEQRLTPVGRLIRNISLDDLPNLVNVLRGEMSLVGPRPMEPERVDLTDPTWQHILSVRPGLVSFAILQLARRYNASDAAAKNVLELRYVQQRSLGYNLALFRLPQRLTAILIHLAIGATILLVVWLAPSSEAESAPAKATLANAEGKKPPEKHKRS